MGMNTFKVISSTYCSKHSIIDTGLGNFRCLWEGIDGE